MHCRSLLLHCRSLLLTERHMVIDELKPCHNMQMQDMRLCAVAVSVQDMRLCAVAVSVQDIRLCAVAVSVQVLDRFVRIVKYSCRDSCIRKFIYQVLRAEMEVGTRTLV